VEKRFLENFGNIVRWNGPFGVCLAFLLSTLISYIRTLNWNVWCVRAGGSSVDHGPEGHQPYPPEIRLFVRETGRLPGVVRVGNRSWSHMGTGRVSHLLLPACLTIPQTMCTSVTGRRWPRRSVSSRPRVSYRVPWILPTRRADFVCV